jgi:hypothetical protein
VGGGLEISGMVLCGGLALGVGAPSVADLSAALLLMIMGRAIRLPGPDLLPLAWLGLTLAFVMVAIRWGSPSLESIQGAHGVLGLTTGTEFTVAATLFAVLGALIGLASHLSLAPPGVEEWIIRAAGALAGGLAVGAVFLGQAGKEALSIPIGLVVGAAALGLGILLSKASGRVPSVAAVASSVLPAVGLGLVVFGP